MDDTQPFNADTVVAGLKPFQRRTVDYAFERLFADGGSRRFLVADEVGLGKTLVARGVIARTLERLQDSEPRIDIIYVCSNAAIAQQNVRRLNVLGRSDFAIASRLTLLPERVHALNQNRINFISLTPGTTFNLRSSTGVAQERVLLYHLLADLEGVDDTGLRNFLQCGVGKRERWRELIDNGPDQIDSTLARSFARAVGEDLDLRQRLLDTSEQFNAYVRPRDDAEWYARNALVGDLRRRLARVCLEALRPSLVILDEFQRFSSLLNGDTEEAALAQELFGIEGCRLLLLSATPYRMLTLHGESEEDHHEDFLKTVGFLYGHAEQTAGLRADLQGYRSACRKLAESDTDTIREARDRLQARLLQVMCRTERVGLTTRRDAMLEGHEYIAALSPDDLEYARAVDTVAREVGQPDVIEYWKSIPFMLSFMRAYKLRRETDAAMENPSTELRHALRAGEGLASLNQAQIEAFRLSRIPHPRMRHFVQDTVDSGLWRLLWLPPSLPYTVPEGPYASVGAPTKQLVFSAWQAVPDAIATLCSFEAESRAMTASDRAVNYSEVHNRVRAPLQFRTDTTGRLAGMPALVRILPAQRLAQELDPLRITLAGGEGQPLALADMLERATTRCADLLAELPLGAAEGRVDERWYWAAVAMLEHQPDLLSWAEDPSGWEAVLPERDESREQFRRHVEELAKAMRGQLDLGVRPPDLAEVVARIALAAPGACSIRALKRLVPDTSWHDRQLLSGAARIANSFRTLFNLPESIALIQARDSQPYWRQALAYALEGNIQAVLDEQVHMLPEQLGLMDAKPASLITGVAQALAEALSMRSSQLKVDELRADGRRIAISDIHLRCRFALRFGEMRDDQDRTVARADSVRAAFNSPFRPFVLASTSVGQEGLDFHTWCHSVVHWNLPSNPVDMEQREGRVHRYKGHAVRRNIAQSLGLKALAEWDGVGDPWTFLFDKAQQTREGQSSDLAPFWIFEAGDARIQRRVLLLPLSRDIPRLRRMKRWLALYRMVFGQPRQEDLIAYLDQAMPEDIEQIEDWQISLLPPPGLDGFPPPKEEAPTSAEHCVESRTVEHRLT